MKSFKITLLLLILGISSCINESKTDIISERMAIENGLLPPILVKGDSGHGFNIEDRMKHYNVPGVSIAVVKGGEIRWAKGYGIANTNNGNKVDTNTLFQAGSISKPLAALSVLKLVENGTLELDEDVNKYLKEWKVAENNFTLNEKVTMRRLLTHTAGMTVHGFPGYRQNDTFPSITEVLNGEGNTPEIIVDTIPGSVWRYSGGGYTVMEKVVEDITGLPFDENMSKIILKAIDMQNSTYQQPLPAKYHHQASAAYNSDGQIIDGLWHNYPEQAAAGLWTTPTDLAKYCIEIQQILAGKEDGILLKSTIEQMLTKHKNGWGLGPSLLWEHDSLIFRHGGKNAGFTNNFISFANRGDAVIIMTNADNGGKLIGEITRSISKYYDWGISNPQVVQLVDVDPKTLDQLIGTYVLDSQVDGIGDYFIDIEIKDNKLFVTDPNNGDTNILDALDESKFIDLATGDVVEFQTDEDQIGILWNGSFQFYKVNQ